MIAYRSFLNCDPPAIAEIWCAQPPQRGLMQPMTPDVLDQLVLAKPYFERDGLIIAEEEGKPVGFAHGGFAATVSGDGLDYTQGSTCLLLVAPSDQQFAVAKALLAETEAYLRGCGAEKFFGGGMDWMAAFYFGVYGGGRLCGVMESDALQCGVFRESGFVERKRTRLLQRDLVGFRPVVNRETMQLRRQCQLQRIGDALATNWWEATSLGQIDQVRFELARRNDDVRLGQVSFWDIEPLASSWGVHAMGMLDFDVRDETRRATVATFMLGEAMRELQSFGVTLVEVQADEADAELFAVCKKLGFEQIDTGIQFERPNPGG